MLKNLQLILLKHSSSIIHYIENLNIEYHSIGQINKESNPG
jgi:hypothetical protein